MKGMIRMNFWAVIAFFFWSYVFIAYLMILVSIVADLFRDHELNGGFKALWIIFLVFVPFVTALVYLIARGRGMSERAAARAQQGRAAADDYIRAAAGSSPADDITKAKALFDSGAITQAEFDSLKQRAIGGRSPSMASRGI
jgi:hypothetical protein